MDNLKCISKNDIENFSNHYHSRVENETISNAVIKNGIKNVSLNNQSLINMNYTFSNEIDAGTITNQKKSGRCWMFAGLNLLRINVMKKCNLENFEFSESYGMFYDKFEKFNCFLENIIETIDEDVNSRTVELLLRSGIQDGGEWNMFCNIVKKYGLVPKYVMPETFSSSESDSMNNILDLKATKCAHELREMKHSGKSMNEIYKAKHEMVKEAYSILCMFLGEPPKKFDFEYKDKDKKFKCDYNMTPKDFYDKYVGVNLDDYAVIVNCPTEDKPFNKIYNIKFMQNMMGGQENNYLNLDIDTFKKLIVNQLLSNEPVWFACDVGKQMDKEKGIMDNHLFNYESVLNTNLGMSKGNKINYRQICPTHAMLFTGVNIINEKPNKYKVENSWGDKNGEKGFFIMSDEWFDEYMIEGIVNKKYIPDEIKKLFDQEPIKLPPWDVLSSLMK